MVDVSKVSGIAAVGSAAIPRSCRPDQWDCETPPLQGARDEGPSGENQSRTAAPQRDSSQSGSYGPERGCSIRQWNRDSACLLRKHEMGTNVEAPRFCRNGPPVFRQPEPGGLFAVVELGVNAGTSVCTMGFRPSMKSPEEHHALGRQQQHRSRRDSGA